MKEMVKAVQFGCGPIGCSIVRLALEKPNIQIAGAIDLVNIGKDLGDVANTKTKLGVKITNDVDTVLNQTKPDIVLHSTSSSFELIFPQLKKVIRAGSNIVSSCEELSYPFRTQPELTEKIDALAKEYGVTVLATGVNPGFLMDTWPLFMTGVCQSVKQIKAVRIQDASSRRFPFQQKIGAGKTITEFNKLVEGGKLRHVGLSESIGMIAAGLGWELDDISETLKPVVAQTETGSDFITVYPGQAAGVKQIGYGVKGGKNVITLEFIAYLGAEDSFDAIYITGIPNMEVVIKGGTHGDLATSAIIVNSIPRVINAPSGLLTMNDLPPVYAI